MTSEMGPKRRSQKAREAGRAARPSARLDPALPAIALIALVLAVFGQVAGFDFVAHDDPDYITENPQVLRGLSVEGLVWAFTSGHGGTWQPLSWLSHMLDVTLYGVDPAGHHVTSLLLHALAAVLLFLALRSMTGRSVLAFLVAALFAVHPLRAESVAWVCERKDVLSGAFGIAAMWAYARWARSRTPGAYAAAGALLAAGLMAKPMLVTLPVVFLLLDIWPLERLRLPGTRPARPEPAGRLIVEKLPFVPLVALSSAVTFQVQEKAGAVAGLSQIALAERVANALVAYVRYLGKTLWPAELYFPYPHPYLDGGPGLPAWQIAGAALLLVGLTALAWRLRRHAYLLAGWLWFVGMLVPVIGIVQISYAAMADRFTYLPQIGLLIALVWGGDALATRVPRFGSEPLRRRAAFAAGLVIVALLAGTAAQQARIWRGSIALYRHALEHAPKGPLTAPLHTWLGTALALEGRLGEALPHHETAVRLLPDDAKGRTGLGLTLRELGRAREALPHLAEAARLRPDRALHHNNLGQALIDLGQPQEARRVLRRAVELDPDYAEAHYNLALALLDLDDAAGAAQSYREAIRADPELAEPYNNLAILLYRAGRVDEATSMLEAYRARGGTPHPGFVRALKEARRRKEGAR